MAATQQDRPVSTFQKQSKPLISHTSILIFSAFLIGMASGQMTGTGSENYALLSGVVGLISYLGLAELSRRRKIRAATTALEQAHSEMERRLDRHIGGHPQA